MADVCVVGAGSFGCALAVALSAGGNNITIWSFQEEEKAEILKHRENRSRLPGVKIPKEVEITTDPAEISGCDFVFFAVPSQFLRSTAQKLKAAVSSEAIVVNTSKGLEEGTFKGGFEVLKEEFSKNEVAIICGPSHAEELARGVCTSFVVASPSRSACLKVKEVVTNPFVQVFCSNDTKGIELCSTIKNVVAIGAGICLGLGAGANTVAALITKGLAEMVEFGRAFGAKPETFWGLAGLGDLIVTCESEHSRNQQMGRLVGAGVPVLEALAKVSMVVEGYENAKTVHQMAKNARVNTPLLTCIYDILFAGAEPGKVYAAINTFAQD